MSAQAIAITAQPVTAVQCKFMVSEPVYAEKSYYFGSREAAEGSPLAERLFGIEGVRAVLLSHNVVTVTKSGPREWMAVGKEVGAALGALLLYVRYSSVSSSSNFAK